MRLGIGSYACPWSIGVPGYPGPEPMSPAGLLRLADGHDVRLVQVADNLPLHRLGRAELGEFKNLAEELGIEVEVGTRGIAPDHLDRYLDLALELNSRLVRVVVDTADSRPEPEEVVGRLGDRAPRFEDAGVTLALENHDRFSVRTLARIVEAVASPCLGICLDTVNSLGSLEGPDVVIDVLGPLAVNVHIKDFAISRLDHMMGFLVEGRPAGQGRLDIPRLLASLSGFNRDPNLILELWPPFGAGVEESVRRERLWLAESVEYLKGVLRDVPDETGPARV